MGRLESPSADFQMCKNLRRALKLFVEVNEKRRASTCRNTLWRNIFPWIKL